jgi:general secretion pathway protein D
MKRLLLAPALALALAAGVAAQTTLNVRDADIRAFIADAAKVTGRTFIIDSRVNGKVTVVTDRPLSRSEYFEVFLSTLRANGLVAVPSVNGVLRIQPIDNAASQPTPVGARAAVNRNSFITEVVRLHQIDAQTALETVRPLVSQQGAVTANRGGNSLVIVDFADNIRRVRQVLARIDTDTASTRVITLRNANAREIATALTALAGTGAPGANGAAGGGPGVSVVAVESSNSIALRGDAAGVARLAAAAIDLDQKAKSGTQIKVVFLENADASQLLPVLQQLVGQAPDPVPQQTLSRSNFGTSNSNATGTNTNLVATAPTQAQNQAGTATPGGTPQSAAISSAGRTAAVVTRFVGANAIVIAAPADIQRQLSEVIRQLDTRREQVLVEAIVAEVSDATAATLGGQLLLGNTKGGAFAASTFADSAPNLLQIAGAIGATKLATSSTTTVNTDGSTTTTSSTNDAATSLQQSAISSILGSSGGLLGGGGKIGDTIFAAIINAVKSDTHSSLLQAPHVVVLDNTESRLLVGQEVPITTGEAVSLASANLNNAFRTTQRENVGIQLEVKPQVNSSGAIKLFIHQQVSSISGPVSSGNSDLILNKREVETTQVVDDGQIVLIAGLLDDNERRTIEKTPLLGDIPLLGTLFKQKSRARTKTNLMVFIRPTILRTPEDSRRVTEQRYGYLRLQQGLANPDAAPSIDQLVRDYLGAAPPIPSAPVPGNIDDPRVPVPTVTNTSSQMRVKR